MSFTTMFKIIWAMQIYAGKALGIAKTYGGFNNVERRAAGHFNMC